MTATLALFLVSACPYVSDADLADRLDGDDDGVPRGTDCDDHDPWVGAPIEGYADGDHDGFGGLEPLVRCPAAGAVAPRSDDCDDGNPLVNPAADERCNALDDDCDERVDDGVTVPPWYLDADGDGYGDGTQVLLACAQPLRRVANALDCDDSSYGVSPDGTDLAGDGIDQDCSGSDLNPFAEYVAGMVDVPAGTFCMGCGAGDPTDLYLDHEVTLTHPFRIGATEVTSGDWRNWALWVGDQPSYHTDSWSYPVESVSWAEAAQFANAGSAAEGLQLCFLADGSALAPEFADDPYACTGYRFPTEAEWEYAAQATRDHEFSGSDYPYGVAWYVVNAWLSTHEVATLQANYWHLYDMSGNVAEWTLDGYDEGYYAASPAADPYRSAVDADPVVRGGGVASTSTGIRVGARDYRTAGGPSWVVGFRLVRTAP